MKNEELFKILFGIYYKKTRVEIEATEKVSSYSSRKIRKYNK